MSGLFQRAETLQAMPVFTSSRCTFLESASISLNSQCSPKTAAFKVFARRVGLVSFRPVPACINGTPVLLYRLKHDLDTGLI